MNKGALMIGILCLGLALVILLFADGARRWYSGFFFALLGAVVLVNAAVRSKGSDK